MILFSVAITFSIKHAIKKHLTNSRLSRIGEHPGYRMIKVIIYVLIFVALIVIWGIGGNFWIIISGVLGLIAIGFVAVWSILSNILAGLILLFSKLFKKGDELIFLPENIQGKIVELDFMFIFLKDEEGNFFQIPNNMVFQKIVKKVKKG